MRFTVDELAAATGGRRTGPPTAVAGATTDSRAVTPGQLFVPVVGERDGHDYVAVAVAAGAPAYLTSRGPVTGLDATAIEVDDTITALADVGRAARRRLTGPVVAITGSVGKTSAKDLTAAVLATRLRTAAALRSFNNELGVPLTLIEAPDDSEAVVVEMGARGIGHVAHLCTVARPTVGVVTTVGAAHLELFGSIDDVARGKGELVEALPVDGTAVLNAEDPRVAAMASRTSAAVLRYGRDPATADVVAEDVTLDEALRPRFTLCSPWGSASVRLEVRGRHMVGNALAAAAVGLALGVGPEAVARGLGEAALSPWRMEVGPGAGGVVVLNDAYNANPLSMRAALEALAALPAERRIAVLGPMAELGEGEGAAHQVVAELAASLGVVIVAVGSDLYGVEPVADVDAAVARLAGLDLGRGDAVLVKASRVAGLERLAARLVVVPEAVRPIAGVGPVTGSAGHGGGVG